MAEKLNELQQSLTGPNREFALGAIYGVRTWRFSIHPLHGPELIGQWNGQWLGKRNIATCRKTAAVTMNFVCSNDPAVTERRAQQAIEHAEAELKSMYKVATDFQASISYTSEGSGYSWTEVWQPTARDNVLKISDMPQSTAQMADVRMFGLASVSAHVSCDKICDPECTCGFYAYTAPKDGVASLFTSHSSRVAGSGGLNFSPKYLIAGVMKGYGAVTIGTRGFRAEKADIVALVPNPEVPIAVIDTLRDSTGVDVLPWSVWLEPEQLETYLEVIEPDAYVQSRNTWVY